MKKACRSLSTMIEQWLLNVNNCEQWLLTTVADRVQHNIVEQCACITTLQQVVDNIDQVVHFCACTLINEVNKNQKLRINL